MAWVKLDTNFPWHRKMLGLTDAQFRVHVTMLCWCAANLTDGYVTEEETRRVMRQKWRRSVGEALEIAGLWERTSDGWIIHDYLDYNPPAELEKVRRKKNAARQQVFRDRHSDPRNDVTAETRNAVTRQPRNAPAPRIVPSRPVPCETPTEFQHAAYARAERGPVVPPNCQPLVDAMTAAGVVVGWGLSELEWFKVEAMIKSRGIPHMVQAAVAQHAAKQIRKAQFFVDYVWLELPAVPPEQQNTDVTSKSRKQRETDDWFERGMARAREQDLYGTPSVFDVPDSPFPREIES